MSYPTLDYLPDLTPSEMSSARTLTFAPYSVSGIDWDVRANAYGSENYAILHALYTFTAVAGATYDLYSTSFFDPFVLIVYDAQGNAIVANDESNDGSDVYLVDAYYSQDIIYDWVAPYSGTYFVNASWHQGSYYTFYSLSVYGDLDTAVVLPSLAIAGSPAGQLEGNSGSTNYTFVISRTGSASGSSTVNWTVTSGAAVGSDFFGGGFPTGTVTFAAGETSKQINVPIAGDTVVEQDEVFIVTLSSPTNATLGTASAIGIIVNDDAGDVTAPIVSTFNPADEATGVSISQNIVVTFSESIQRGTGNIVLKTSAGTVIGTYAAATSGNLSIVGSTLTINPTTDLNYSTGYMVEIAFGAIKDLAGNSYAGITSYNFTTAADPAAGVTLSGTSANDNLTGTAGPDTLNGLGGNDTLWGMGHNDALIGGEGTDTGRYGSVASNFRVAQGSGQFSVEDKTGVEGLDVLTSVERIQFSDKTFDLVNLPRQGVPAYGQQNGFLFDPVFYLLDNPELVPTQTLTTALQHYFNTGAAQGKQPNSWFDPTYYEDRWPDLKAGNFSDDVLFIHYNLYGVWEGRSAGPKFDKFDGNRYLTDNPDVAAYVDAYVADFLGSRTNGAIAHYVIYGQHEQRPAFDLVGQPIDLGYTVDLGG